MFCYPNLPIDWHTKTNFVFADSALFRATQQTNNYTWCARAFHNFYRPLNPWDGGGLQTCFQDGLKPPSRGPVKSFSGGSVKMLA